MKFIIISILLLMASITLSAQHVRFLTEGVIEFERSTNVHALLDKRMKARNNNFMEQVYEQIKRSSPPFLRSKSILSFSNDKTLFQPVEDEAVPNRFLADDPAFNQINHIYSDLAAHKLVTQKKVYEETFLISDSTRKINWKITEERRDIAGFSCRRANAIIMDSIYVVAFYCDEIAVSGGPESFNGLPGMILGVALPHENVTWFAKEVKDTPVSMKVIVPPNKGKKVDNIGFINTLKSALKNWGTEMKTALKIYLL